MSELPTFNTYPWLTSLCMAIMRFWRSPCWVLIMTLIISELHSSDLYRLTLKTSLSWLPRKKYNITISMLKHAFYNFGTTVLQTVVHIIVSSSSNIAQKFGKKSGRFCRNLSLYFQFCVDKILIVDWVHLGVNKIRFCALGGGK